MSSPLTRSNSHFEPLVPHLGRVAAAAAASLSNSHFSPHPHSHALHSPHQQLVICIKDALLRRPHPASHLSGTSECVCVCMSEWVSGSDGYLVTGLQSSTLLVVKGAFSRHRPYQGTRRASSRDPISQLTRQVRHHHDMISLVKSKAKRQELLWERVSEWRVQSEWISLFARKTRLICGSKRIRTENGFLGESTSNNYLPRFKQMYRFWPLEKRRWLVAN